MLPGERVNVLGCPRVIRVDKGTENVHMAAVQYALRCDHMDDFSAGKSFRYGSSPANIVHIIIQVPFSLISSMFV